MATQSVCPKEPGPARDEFLKNLMDDLNCHMAKVTAQWGDRPIASEQDMVEWYRLANPEIGDEYARMTWRLWARATA